MGQGAAGTTYIAWDLQDERKLVIKEYFPAYLSTRSSDQLTLTCLAPEHWTSFNVGLEAFQAEARDLRRLAGNPGLASVLRVFEAHGTAYMVMDHLCGQTLAQHVKTKAAPLPSNKALEALRSTMEALSEMHRFGVLHWDLNPNHIILRSDHESTMIDFGRTRRALRHEGVTIAVRNLEFTPPEQFGPRTLLGGPPTDVYGLAATLYYALTGTKPLSAAERLSGGELATPSSLGVEIPRGPEDAIMTAMSIGPKERQASIETLWSDLRTDGGAGQARSKLVVQPHSVRMFLCHASKDKPKVRELYQRLRSDGMDPWLDEEELIAGQDWETEIKKAVWAADLVVVCLSHQSVNVKGYINRELDFVLDAASQQPPDELYLIPLRP